MESEWVQTTIGDLCDSFGGNLQTGPFGSQLHAHDYVPDGPVPIVTTSSVGKRRLNGDGVPRISQAKAESLGRHYLRAGDIVFARRGVQAAGLSALIEPKHEGWLGGTGIIRLRLPASIVDPAFLSFALSTRNTYEWIRRHAIGATMPNLNEGVVRGVPVALPSLYEQRRIAAILGALDDKIELNRTMNRTLEDIAQAIFKSWFIDFDGVPPEDLVDSELGPIPKAWDLDEIGNATRVVGGGTPSTKNPGYWEGGTHCWTTPKDLSGSENPVLLDTSRRVTDAGLAKISSGLLPIGTFLLSSRAPVGYTAIARVPLAVNQGYIAMPPGGPLSPLYLLHWTRANLDVIKGRAGGTTFQEISKRNFRSIPVIVPPEDRLLHFNEVVCPLFDRIEVNARESTTLADIRNTLLPKLISGEVRVPEAGTRAGAIS